MELNERNSSIKIYFVLFLIGLLMCTGITFGLTMALGKPSVKTYNYIDNEVLVNVVDYTRQPGSGGTATAEQVANVVERVKDSVVEIYSYENMQATSGKAGSGVITHIDGDAKGVYIITNHHVIDGQRVIIVKLRTGETYDAELIGGDPYGDIAVLRIENQAGFGNIVASIRSGDSVRAGDTAIVIGNPLGTLPGTVTTGIVSSDGNVEIIVGETVMELMQTDAAINPGNSGGAMFDDAGLLIGIINAKVSAAGIEGIGFAIPIENALALANELINSYTGEELGYIRGRFVLGAVISDYTAPNGDNYAMISDITTGSDAWNAGLRIGDIIRQMKIGSTTKLITSYAQILTDIWNQNFDIENENNNKFTLTIQRTYSANPLIGSSTKTVTLTQYKYQMP